MWLYLQTEMSAGSGNKAKLQELIYRDKTNVVPEMCDYISNNWSHRNSNKRFKEKLGSRTRKTFDRFTTKRQLYLEHHT